MTTRYGKVAMLLFAAFALLATAGIPEKAYSQTNKPIVIGLINPFTGPVAHMGQYTTDAIALFMKEHGDTIHGRPLKFVQFDDQCTPSKAVDAANRALGQVVAIIGPNCSGDMAAIEPILKNAKIPHFCPCYLPTLSAHGDDYFFRTIPSDAAMMQVLVDYIKKQGVEKIVLAYDTTGFGEGEKDAILAGLKKRGMPEPLFLLPFDSSVTDFSGQIGKIKSSGAQAIVIAAFEHLEGLFVKQVRELGLTIPVFGGAATSEVQFRQIAGDAANGVVYSSSYTSGDASTADFTKAYRTAYGIDPNANVIGATLAMYALWDVFQKSPDISGDALRDAIRALKLKTPAGFVEWNASGDLRHSFGVLVTVKDGAPVTMEHVELEAP
jgi:branched-chain amino acid transport system substrate-binding protein